MIDDFTKDYRHGRLRSARRTLLGKPDVVMAEYEEQTGRAARSLLEAHP